MFMYIAPHWGNKVTPNIAWRHTNPWSYFKAEIVSLIKIVWTLKDILVVCRQVCQILRFYYMLDSENHATDDTATPLPLFPLAIGQYVKTYVWIHPEFVCAVDCTTSWVFFLAILAAFYIFLFFHVNALWQMVTVLVFQGGVTVATSDATTNIY